MSLMPAFSPYKSAYRFDSLSFVQKDTTTLAATSYSILWKPDGTKLFTVKSGTDNVKVYSAATNWDISTLSTSTDISVTLDSQQTGAGGRNFRFNDDGTKVFILWTGAVAQPYIEEHALSSAYGGTATYTTKITTPTTDSGGASFIFADGGSKIIATDGAQGFYEAAISTPYDLTTKGAWSIKKLDLSGAFTNQVTGLAWGKTEKQLIITVDDKFHEYALSTAADISTASFVRSFDPIAILSDPTHGIFGDGGRRFYGIDSSSDEIAEWSATA